MSLTLRPAGTADRPAMLDLWVAAWTAAMPSIDFAARRAWLDGHLDALQAAGALIIVASDSDGLAGFMTVDTANRTLDQLVVALNRQGRGVARWLIDEAKRLSPSGIILDVNSDNDRAIALYRAAGLTVIREGRNPRSDLPVLHMEWHPTH